jgi:hypothetical protein
LLKVPLVLIVLEEETLKLSIRLKFFSMLINAADLPEVGKSVYLAYSYFR